MTKTKNEPVHGSRRQKAAGASDEATNKYNPQGCHELPAEQSKVVEEISRIHDALRAATRLTAQKAIELGERLTQLKKGVGHGEWLKFAKAHLPFNARTAERYMNVYRHKAQLTDKFDSVSDLSLLEAYATLAEPKMVAAQDPEEAEGDAAPGPCQESQRRNRIVTEIQRSLAEDLERLPVSLLEEFETALRAFKQVWLQQHHGGAN